MTGDLGNVKELEKRVLIRKIIKYFFIYLFLVIMAIYVVLPFYWMVNTSLKSNVEVDYLIPTFFPKDVRWENYLMQCVMLALPLYD